MALKYVVYRWAKPSKRFEPRPHWALLDPNFMGVKVPREYQKIVYAGMDPFTWAHSSEGATYLHRITLSPNEAARCVVAGWDFSISYADSFVRLDKFRDALRYPSYLRNEVLIPFPVSAELIAVPDPKTHPYSFPEVIPRRIAREGYLICSICKDEVPKTSHYDPIYGLFYICKKCTYRIEHAQKSRSRKNYEEIVKLIMKAKPRLTMEAVEKLIEEEREKEGGRQLEDTAAYFLAERLSVNLSMRRA